jgi:phage-related tail fiber protein
VIDNAAARDAWTNGAIPRQRDDAGAMPSWSSDDTLVLPAYVPGDLDSPADAQAVQYAARQAAAAEAMTASTPEAAAVAADHARAAAQLADSAAMARAAFEPTIPGALAAPADFGGTVAGPLGPSAATLPPVNASGHSGVSDPPAVAMPQGRVARAADDGTRLPSSERNMLIFVAMLLAIGAIAVIATMGVGKFG